MSWPPDDAFVVSLADLTLFGQDATSPTGVASLASFYVESLDGWAGSDVKVTTVPRANDHGSYPPVIYYGERHMTLNVHVLGTDLTTRRRGEARLKGTLAALAGTPMRVQEAPFDRTVSVWTDGPITSTPAGSSTIVSVPLRAVDPVRYATVPQSVQLGLPVGGGTWGYSYGYPYGYGGGDSGNAIITNAGDVTVWPTLRIDGPVTNPVVLNATTGELLTVTITLATNEWLDIDGRDEVVMLDGTASRRTAVAPGALFPTVPSGSSLWEFRASAGSGLLTINFADGWS